MMTRHYKVAGHTFAVSVRDELFDQMENYEPFEYEGGEPLFTLTEDSGELPKYTELYRSEREGPCTIFGLTTSGSKVFEFMGRTQSEGCMICSKDYREGRLIMTGFNPKRMLKHALMKMFILTTAGKGTLLLHAVAVSYKGKGYLFLGPAGTGKSTHAQLWIEHIGGTELVNDDFPVVRDGVVYGSPWEFKTPCYRNVSYPIGGFVRLSQAPYNKIHRLSGFEAYLNLFVRDMGNDLNSLAEGIAEDLHQTENALASTIPMWQLDCLPDEEAARLCHDTITR